MVVGADGCSVLRNKLGSGWSIANGGGGLDISTEQLTRQEVGAEEEVGTKIFEEQKKE